jgi:GT2 family glycosyltransferase
VPGRVTASIVLFNHDLEQVRALLENLSRDSECAEWAVVDNGGSERALTLASALGAHPMRPGRNLGFGGAHNLALASLTSLAPYHLILNPDIVLEHGVLTDLATVMDASPQVGSVMPRVLYPDGSTQFLCKLLPTPLDLALRRFATGPVRRIFARQMDGYDMKDFDYSRPVYVPVLSGCFMFTRRSVLNAVGGFDERFFLYMEDIDLCRRMGRLSRLLFWPGTTITHGHAQGSYRQAKLLRLHIRAAFTYFNKWGWFCDPERRQRNRSGLSEAPIDLTGIHVPSHSIR